MMCVMGAKGRGGRVVEVVSTAAGSASMSVP